jgi:hypothetical protein
MYIEPNTNIKILHNVPLENTYDHTLYFANATDQYNYFSSMVKKNCVNYSYQRVNKGTMRIEGKADNYYDCNYLMFQNTNFGTKWFYAFINSVEYVNNETTEIVFEIDEIQTWLFDAHVEECFIERQHSLSDAIGDNIIPETLDLGEYVMNDYAPVTSLVDMCVCLAIVDTNGESAGELYDGIYGSAQLFVYDSTDVSGVNDKIDEFTQKPDAIISIYMFPKALIGGVIPQNHMLPYGTGGANISCVALPVTKQDTLDGYLPKNGKMYTYPYNFYHVDNASGEELSLRYEFFDNLTPVMLVNGTVTQPVALTLRPASYKGVTPFVPGSGYTSLNTEIIGLRNFPICSWNVDAYQAWIAQNAIPIGFKAMGSVGSALVHSGGGYSVNEGVSSSLIHTITSICSENYSASIMADISKGSLNNGCVNVGISKQQFYGGRCSVSYQYAKMIDDFFTMYGYAVKGVGRINTHGRPHWNYVKTVGCVLSGSIPSDSSKKIVSIYDKGITFWRHANEVGNYELDNSLDNA